MHPTTNNEENFSDSGTLLCLHENFLKQNNTFTKTQGCYMDNWETHTDTIFCAKRERVSGLVKFEKQKNVFAILLKTYKSITQTKTVSR